MAQYKTVHFDTLEHTELARQSYLNFERDKDALDEAAVEVAWLHDKEKLRRALNILTPRQREVFILTVAHRLTETQIAKRLGITQQVVSSHFRRARKKLSKFASQFY